MSHISCAALQLNNSPGDWAKELFKLSKDTASLLVWILKTSYVLDFVFFVGDNVSKIGLGSFGQSHLALGPTSGANFLLQLL